MRGEELLDKMELVDPAFVEAADVPTKKRRHRGSRGAAACLAAALLAMVLLLPGEGEDVLSQKVSIGGITREYKTNVQISASEPGIEWRWEEKTVIEQYTDLDFSGMEFTTRAMAVEEAFLDGSGGTGEVSGYDPYERKEYRQSVEVRRIRGVSEERLVAVDLGGEFVVFQRDLDAPPESLGELMELYSLEENLELENFYYVSVNGEEDGDYYGLYCLEDDGPLWEILEACRDAGFAETEMTAYGRSVIFTATSEALGVYKRTLAVTEDGYLKTNLFDWGYAYDIGEEAAGRIIDWAQEHGKEAETVPEPYVNTLAGTIVEITDSFILVDDSVLCRNEEEGMIFRIPADEPQIRRYVRWFDLTAGDIVVVGFTGAVDESEGNLVKGASFIHEGTLTEDGISVTE